MRHTARALGTLVAATTALAVLVPTAAGTSGGETLSVNLIASGKSGERDVITGIVVAKGVFDGNGRLVEVDNLPGDPDNVVRDNLVFAEGTLHLLSTFGESTVSVNPQGCRVTVVVHQTAEIVGGTGIFASASGDFVSTLIGKGSLARNPDGSCAMDLGLLHEQDKIEAVGTLTF